MLLLLTAAVSGQSALDVFDPNANNAVWVVVQPDGKIRVGVFFTTVSGVARNYIARLNTDGTLDAAFNPNANSVVYSIAVQADGKMLESNHQPSGLRVFALSIELGVRLVGARFSSPNIERQS